MTTVARGVLDVLGRAGVRTVFGLPGVHNLAFWRDSGPGTPDIMVVRHEQTTVYAADGLARATGGLGAALTTTGPGAVNAAGALGEAAASNTPLVMIASEISTRLRRPGGGDRRARGDRDAADRTLRQLVAAGAMAGAGDPRRGDRRAGDHGARCGL